MCRSKMHPIFNLHPKMRSKIKNAPHSKTKCTPLVGGNAPHPTPVMHPTPPFSIKITVTTHVGAKFALLRRYFFKLTSSARFLAPPFQIEPASLGFDLGDGGFVSVMM